MTAEPLLRSRNKLEAHIINLQSIKNNIFFKSIDFLLNPFCIKFVTIHLSARNFAIVYLYIEIKLKPKKKNIFVELSKLTNFTRNFTRVLY